VLLEGVAGGTLTTEEILISSKVQVEAENKKIKNV
jgi:hypothetical protein